MFFSRHILPLILLGGGKSIVFPANAASNATHGVWHPPKASWITDLAQVVNGTGVHGFIFNSSINPKGVNYGTYNWCNMPHVRKDTYPEASGDLQLEYIEVIHRHHKRTPYASNQFPHEDISWDCSDIGLSITSSPLLPDFSFPAAATYWNISIPPSQPFAALLPSPNSTCAFPQITHGGFLDSYQHGVDLATVYRSLLGRGYSPEKIKFRATNNIITSQVAGALIRGMFRGRLPAGDRPNIPLQIQPPQIDSLEPTYPCPSSAALTSSIRSSAEWQDHLAASSALYNSLDAVSGVDPNDEGWHSSWDRYYDALSARQCHEKPLPCSPSDPANCILQTQADTVYRLGQWEYSFQYRGSGPQTLQATQASFGVWISELAAHLRSKMSGESEVVYFHNVAHDGSVSRLLSILQLEKMVWPGMGAEVVFELYSRRGSGNHHGSSGARSTKKWYIRILWSGMILRSSNSTLGEAEMLDADIFLNYIDELAGPGANQVVDMCGTEV
ncbi:phosphoglycerate mutase-like protein [Aulographum hederae CBS 113979]|uniref:Phosphoglycerate mutase-like protein n=1 Tax=Aulographum hederae CBS 113979 TaxID=1176131 RepID=A0A6G1GP98_9PEZI|nr:phosphoglycerate mutase-like protein [Aulographum hederae CBS 113979]